MTKPTAPDDIVVIINSASGCGHGSSTVAVIEAEFRTAGQTSRVTCVSPDAIGQAIEHAIQGGARLIVIGGGDGTLSTAASALVNTEVTFGVLPMGTLNHFATDQQIPLDLAGAVRAIATGRVKRVDVGEVNGRVFINNSSLGIYPDIVRLRRRLGFGKWIGLAAATWMVLRRGSTLSIQMVSDTEDRRYRTAFAFVGNNAHLVYKREAAYAFSCAWTTSPLIAPGDCGAQPAAINFTMVPEPTAAALLLAGLLGVGGLATARRRQRGA